MSPSRKPHSYARIGIRYRGVWWRHVCSASFLERLSGKCSAGVRMAYALHYGEQEILYGSVLRRMALHKPASARSHRTRTPQASRLTGYPRRRLLRPKEWLPLAVAAEGLPPWKT